MLMGLRKEPPPPQCTFWRFLASLHLSVAGQILRIQQIMRQRVWEAAHVELKTITLDTDTTVHTLATRMGGRKSYNPKNKGKKSYQPILTFLAETREYVSGELRNGDRPTGKQIARHLEGVFGAVPEGVETIYARADSGFYCAEAVEAYEKAGVRFIISARKTSRLIDGLKAAPWTLPEDQSRRPYLLSARRLSKTYRFIALRYIKKKQAPAAAEQYQLFDTGVQLSRLPSRISAVGSRSWRGSITSGRAPRISLRKQKMMPGSRLIRRDGGR